MEVGRPGWLGVPLLSRVLTITDFKSNRRVVFLGRGSHADTPIVHRFDETEAAIPGLEQHVPLGQGSRWTRVIGHIDRSVAVVGPALQIILGGCGPRIAIDVRCTPRAKGVAYRIMPRSGATVPAVDIRLCDENMSTGGDLKTRVLALVLGIAHRFQTTGNVCAIERDLEPAHIWAAFDVDRHHRPVEHGVVGRVIDAEIGTGAQSGNKGEGDNTLAE